MTLATPPFGKIFGVHVRTVPGSGNTCATFEVRRLTVLELLAFNSHRSTAHTQTHRQTDRRTSNEHNYLCHSLRSLGGDKNTYQFTVLLSLALVLGLEVSSRTNFESLALALLVKSLALALRISPWPWPTGPWPCVWHWDTCSGHLRAIQTLTLDSMLVPAFTALSMFTT